MKLDSFKLFIILCLCVLVVGLLATKEGFEMDTKVCGTAGFKPSDATKKALELLFDTKLPDMRYYTKSECNKMEKGTHNMVECKNGSINYGEVCAGLNKTIKSPAPSECKVDGVVLGKPNVAITQTINGKQAVVDNNALQLYTENECKLLKGGYVSIENMMKSLSALPDEIPKAIQLNGDKYGLCLGDTPYSLICTVDAPPSMTGDVSDAAKKHLTNWLK